VLSMNAIPARRRGRDDHLARSAARGAALVALAVVIGIVLLNVVDRGTPGSGNNGTGAAATVPTTGASTGSTVAGATTTKPGSTLTSAGKTTTTKKGAGRDAKEVRVTVLNGSGISQAATTKANDLRALGYVIATTGNAEAVQTGNTVACRSGFSKEAATLAEKVTNATVASNFPNPAPADTDCVVTLGK
jgi:hypothetical protein